MLLRNEIKIFLSGSVVKQEMLNGNVLNQYYMNVNNCPVELHQYLSSECPPVQYTPVKTLPFWVNNQFFSNKLYLN